MCSMPGKQRKPSSNTNRTLTHLLSHQSTTMATKSQRQTDQRDCTLRLCLLTQCPSPSFECTCVQTLLTHPQAKDYKAVGHPPSLVW